MDFNELKDAVLSALGQATTRAGDVTGKAADKMKSGGRIAKLAMDAASAREELKKTYLEIGKLYYDTHKEDPEGFFVQLFEEVRLAEEDISAMETELSALRESLKGKAAGEDADDFERVVDETDSFAETADEAEDGDESGEARHAFTDRFEAIRKTVQEKAGDVKEIVSEKGGVVKDTVVEKVGAAKDAVSAKIAEVRTGTAEKAEDLAEDAGKEFEAAVKKAEDVAGDVAEAAESAVKKAESAAEAAADTLTDGGQE